VPAYVIAYHYIAEGGAQLLFEGAQPIDIAAGEIVVFPSNEKHILGSDLGITPVSAKSLVQPPQPAVR
jgi:hypothetical protein